MSISGTNSSSTASSALSGLMGGGSDPASAAASRRTAADDAWKSQFSEIQNKGFANWARDEQVKKLKEELRKKVMAGMGLDEKSLSQMSSAMQRAIEERIQQAIEEELKNSTNQMASNGQKRSSNQANSADRGGSNSPPPSAHTATSQAAVYAQNVDQQSQSTGVAAQAQSNADGTVTSTDGTTAPKGAAKVKVIPALSWPGAPSVF